MTQKRLKEIGARCEAATGGPWLRHENVECMFTVFVANTSIAETSRCNLRNKQKLLNAEFIAHARQDLPDCLDEIERLQQELSLEKANAEMRRKEILLGVKEIVRWRTEAERLLVKRPTNNCDCGNPINHDYCTRCLRQWES